MRKLTQLVWQYPRYLSFRALGRPRLLPFNYTFLISTQCNARCQMCNIWQQKHFSFSLAEWERIFESLGKSVFWATVSGGEPFLQPHLARMVVALDRICQPAIINLPTNGTLTARIEQQVLFILAAVKEAKVVINISLDGVGKDHDRIRGVPGCFEKAMATYKGLKKIQKKHPNLVVGFGTVISNYNLRGVEKVIDRVFDLEPDQYVTEIAEERVELGTVGQALTPSLQAYRGKAEYLLMKMKKSRFRGLGRVSRAFRFQYYRFVQDWLAGKKLLPDWAGWASVEITSWGDVWPSCIKGEMMGNMREAGGDFRKVWFSDQSQMIRQAIREQGSSYPLANAFYSSAIFHGPTLAKVGWRIIFP